ncbi:MAG: NUDIX hydrolase [Elainellaceae cyanobacterium]
MNLSSAAQTSTTVPISAPRIRVITLGLIKHCDRLLVSEGYDTIKQQQFFRALGGGVEFGETSVEALQREFWEEIQAELTNIHYLGCIENLFVYEGKPKHELIQLYQCDFADEALYQKEVIIGNEGGEPFTATWVECDRLSAGELRLMPEECRKFL